MNRRLGTHLTLWGGNVEKLSLPARLAAANAGGFTSVSLSPADVQRWQQKGISLDAIRSEVAAAGVRVTGVEPVKTWLNLAAPAAGTNAQAVGGKSPETHAVLSLARELGADLVTATVDAGERLALEPTATSFALLCDTALAYGLRIGLEAMPFSAIPDLGLAWDIVRTASRPNGGLVLDSWHVFRSPRPVADLELIRSLPGDRVFAVHLDDAPARPRGDDLAYETDHWRQVPGEGELDLDRFTAYVQSIGANAAVGPEVFCDDLLALSPEDLGRRLGEATDRYVQAPLGCTCHRTRSDHS